MLISRITVDPTRLDPLGPGPETFVDLNAEYVELRNETTQAVNISSWTLTKEGASFTAFQFPPDTTVGSQRSLRIHTGEGNQTRSDYYWHLSESIWTQIGETASLRDAGGTLIDQRAYPTLLPNFQALTSPYGLLTATGTERQNYRPAIELAWDLPILLPSSESDETPDFPDPEAIALGILRRERRFPGNNRRGVIPVEIDQTDGQLVYDSASFHYDVATTQSEQEGNYFITTTRQYRYRENPQDIKDKILVRIIQKVGQKTSSLEEDVIPMRMAVRYFDRQVLQPGALYYYTAFINSENRPIFNSQTQSSALATGQHGHQLFINLPQVHQRFDTVIPAPDTVSRADQSKGQLQRFLEVVESHANMLHGMVDGLHDLHNSHRVDSRFLPHLAHLIGWNPKDYLNEDQQRNEISFAPEIYKTVGTIPTIIATINQVIQWKSKVREFGLNVLRSFDPSRLETRGSQTVYLDGSLDPPPMPAGSFDFTDAVAISKLRANSTDDKTAYTYDCRQATSFGNITNRVGWYNLETIGIYMSPETDSDVFDFEEAGARIRQILREFLPIQVRVVFFPLLEDEGEEIYNTQQRVQESRQDLGLQILSEDFHSSVSEASSDSIPGWQVLVANHPEHQVTNPLFRIWHSALDQNIADLPEDVNGDE